MLFQEDSSDAAKDGVEDDDDDDDDARGGNSWSSCVGPSRRTAFKNMPARNGRIIPGSPVNESD